ncbi:uncharacterized protein STEHIDRAFT_146870 [Stereum hirsutum FP-91666 SS1]|uniref:uncharacterized protein n=1 Tax=Stereum hirsutum (strain FP-91666) TaxID=721885 RepID=UPI000440E53B|nr:uncharacterized protein STEHIDRAFT_146870 [Stereum hirsutum FP-91666 SS1]EIM87518.1 hypothetical protein STEHIDRAFT_146870 [Stereum hirsutum FP-91666 SS1]
MNLSAQHNTTLSTVKHGAPHKTRPLRIIVATGPQWTDDEIGSRLASQLDQHTYATLCEAISHEDMPYDRDWNNLSRSIGLPAGFPLLASDIELQDNPLDCLRSLLRSLSGRQLATTSSSHTTRVKYYKFLLLRAMQAVESALDLQGSADQCASTGGEIHHTAPLGRRQREAETLLKTAHEVLQRLNRLLKLRHLVGDVLNDL